MIKSSILISSVLAICLSLSVNGQTSNIPPEFYNLSEEDVSNKMDFGQLSKEDQERLTENTFYQKKAYFKNGYLYLENEITNYVQDILDDLLDTSPKRKENIKLYITRSSSVNAFCMADGSLYVNIGLIADMDSRSQLAYILAHEISHYSNNHLVEEMIRIEQLEKDETSSKNVKNRALIRKLQYSKEYEFDADAEGLRILGKSNYDFREAVKALAQLKEADTLFDSDAEFNILDKYFKTSYVEYDTSWVTEEKILYLKEEQKRTNPLDVFSQDFGDALTTHPNIGKRIYALKEIIKNYQETELIDTTKIEIDNGSSYREIKKLAELEILDNSLKNGQYLLAIYNSVRLLNQYPDDSYLTAALIKAVYWVGYYKGVNDGLLEINEPTIINDKFYWRIKSLYQNLSSEDSKEAAYGMAKELYDANPKDQSTLFYLGLNADSYLGKNASLGYYEKYLREYPTGKYASFVNNRLNR